MPDFEIKDVFRETRVFTTRSIVIGVFLLILIGILLTRLFYLQVVEYDPADILLRELHISGWAHDNAPGTGRIEHKILFRLDQVREQ